MGCKIYGTPKDIQHAAINMLPHLFTQCIMKLFRISIAEILDLLNPKISQIFRNRFPDAWVFL